MGNTTVLKRRIGSVKNTKQITKAMELVAASKMRKAQEYAAAGREYREHAYSLLTRLSTITEVGEHPLYVTRDIKTKLYIAITSNRGLAGAYNANVLRMLTKKVSADKSAGVNVKILAIGKQAANFVRRIEGVELVAAYVEIDDKPSANDVRPILKSAIEKYATEEVDNVALIYTQFKSSLVQDATELSLLPARFVDTDEKQKEFNSTFEPSIDVVLDSITERLLDVQLLQCLLESIASEHSMRMMAMKSATDNASDLIDDLTLEFNTARQSSITQELAEITGGAAAIAG
jgi:F-type H+-transporting ATPase subunit gamma